MTNDIIHEKHVLSISNSLKSDSKYDMKFFLLLIGFVLFLLLLPSVIRYFSNGSFILGSSSSYHHLRISEIVLEEGAYPVNDELSYGGRKFNLESIYEFIIVVIHKYTGIDMMYLLLYLPVLLGIMSSILLYNLLFQLGFSKFFRRVYSTLFCTSPLFLYLFTVSNYHYIPIFLILLAFNMFLSKNITFRFLSVFIFLMIPFFGYLPIFVSAIMLILFFSKVKSHHVLISTSFIVLILFSIKIKIFDFLPVAFRHDADISTFKFLISDLGFLSGISLFLLVLFVLGFLNIGTLSKLKTKQTDRDVFLFLNFAIFLLLVIFYFLSDDVLYYLNFIFVFYASYGLIYLIKFKYTSKMIKYIIMLLLISSILFVPISYVNRMVDFYPDGDVIDSMKFFSYLSSDDMTVFSSVENGVLINSIANRKNLMDDRFAFAPDVQSRMNDTRLVMYSRDLDLVNSIFEKYDVGYVLIDANMRKNWIHDDQGLLFLLKTSNQFEKIYDSDDVVIYQFYPNLINS